MELPDTSDTKLEATPQEAPSPVVAPVSSPIKKDTKETTLPSASQEKIPPVAPAVPVRQKSILPGTILSKEDKLQISLKKKNQEQQVALMKHITFLFALCSVTWFLWLQINMSPNNNVLSIVGVNENVGQKIERLKKDRTKIKVKNSGLEKNIKKIEKKLETKTYTRFTEEIQKIRDQQIQWFDEIDEEGNIIFGLVDAVPRMQDYFNSRSYTDPNSILSGKHSDIQIENLQASRAGVNFSVLGSQILGKVFYLNIEFIEMVNSFPFLKDGKITQFARQKNADEDDMMRFSVRLDRQLPEEKDLADERFIEYLTWLNSVTNK